MSPRRRVRTSTKSSCALRWSGYVGGRLQIDATVFDNDERGPKDIGGIQARRARLDVGGTVGDCSFVTELEFADDVVELKETTLATQFGPGQVIVGHTLPYITMDARTSSSHAPFIERSMLTGMLWPTYRWAAVYQGYTDHSIWHVSAYNQDADDAEDADGWGAVTRLAWVPTYGERHFLHLGVGAGAEQFGISNAIDPETGDHPAQGATVSVWPIGRMGMRARTTLLQINNGKRVDDHKGSLEIAGGLGRFSFQAEGGRADYDDGIETGEVNGYFGLVTWFLTDDVHPYDRKLGRFARVKPKHPFGAFEVGARFEHSHGEQGGAEGALTRDIDIEAISATLNWYRNPYIRFSLDVTHAKIDDELNDVAHADSLLIRR